LMSRAGLITCMSVLVACCFFRLPLGRSQDVAMVLLSSGWLRSSVF